MRSFQKKTPKEAAKTELSNVLPVKKFYGDESFNDFRYVYEPIIRKHFPDASDQDVENALLHMFSRVPSLMARLVIDE